MGIFYGIDRFSLIEQVHHIFIHALGICKSGIPVFSHTKLLETVPVRVVYSTKRFPLGFVNIWDDSALKPLTS